MISVIRLADVYGVMFPGLCFYLSDISAVS